MPVKRRAPGQRLRRSRRRMELEQIERTDPEKYAELVELRRLSPQQFRKELARLIKKGKIVKGRTFRLHADHLALLEGEDFAAFKDAVEAIIDTGEADFRVVGGLHQEERQTRARPDWVAYLNERYQGMLDETNRRIM